MNIKQFGIAVALLAVLAVVFGFWASNTPQQELSQETHLLEGTKNADGTYTYVEETEFYTIEVDYPDRVPVRESDRAQTTLEQGLQQEIARFKSTVQEFLTPDEQERLRAEGRTYAFIMEYEAGEGEGTVSYAYVMYEETGGAHPNVYFKTFVFNQQGDLVTLGSLFPNNPNWLEELSLRVSNQVVADMQERTEQDDVAELVFDEGLAPAEANFQNFVIDGADLIVLIPPYQVAAYAAGSFQVRIPLVELQ